MTLVGFSLGARVIFKCLQVLAETETDGNYDIGLKFLAVCAMQAQI